MDTTSLLRDEITVKKALERTQVSFFNGSSKSVVKVLGKFTLCCSLTNYYDNIYNITPPSSTFPPIVPYQNNYAKSVCNNGFVKNLFNGIILVLSAISLWNSQNMDHDTLVPPSGSEFGQGFHLIVAGAAPGKAYAYLKKLFPKLEMTLIDPAEQLGLNNLGVANWSEFSYNEFLRSKDSFGNNDVHIIHELADQHMMTRIANANHYTDKKRLLFLSDIRGDVPPRIHPVNSPGSIAQSLQIQTDMQDQHDMAVNLNPFVALFKFKLPYESGSSMYYPGKMYSQNFLRCNSSETALICTHVDLHIGYVNYSHDNHNNTCFTYNTKIKTPDGQGLRADEINNTPEGKKTGNRYFKGTNRSPNVAYEDSKTLGIIISGIQGIDYENNKRIIVNKVNNKGSKGGAGKVVVEKLFPEFKGRVFDIFNEVLDNVYEKSILLNNTDDPF